MRNTAKNFSSVALLLVTVVLNVHGAQAADNQVVAQVTNYDDGIKISEYADNSGFKVEGGGAVFTYDEKTKTMSCSNVNGTSMSFSFDNTK